MSSSLEQGDLSVVAEADYQQSGMSMIYWQGQRVGELDLEGCLYNTQGSDQDLNDLFREAGITPDQAAASIYTQELERRGRRAAKQRHQLDPDILEMGDPGEEYHETVAYSRHDW